jgi:hypothetical protein
MAVSASSGGASTTSTAASMSAAAAPASAPAAAAAFAATAPDATLPDAAGISSPHELTDWVERLVDGLEAKFNGMSESVEVRSEWFFLMSRSRCAGGGVFCASRKCAGGGLRVPLATSLVAALLRQAVYSWEGAR